MIDESGHKTDKNSGVFDNEGELCCRGIMLSLHRQSSVLIVKIC